MKTVLLAIPENQVSRQLISALNDRNIPVVSYSSAHAGICLPEGPHTISMAIVDTDLPGINGYDLVRLIRESDSGQIPVILLAWFNLSSLKMAHDLGCMEILSKPVGFDELLTVVDKYSPLNQDFQLPPIMSNPV
jgi:DNA-binding response OmpR family regulator